MEVNDKFFAQDDIFWENYLKGRPRVPDSFFDRIFDYHKAKGGHFGTVHDVGAGNGPYALRLRSRFDHVIVSDIVANNIELARRRLQGEEGFSFRTSRLQDADDIAAGSVDMVFATNVMHFADPQDIAMAAIAHQLRPGALFRQGGRQLLNKANDPTETARVMLRTQGTRGIQSMLPLDDVHQTTPEPNYTGPDDAEIYEDDEGWSFETDLAGVKEHFESFPFVSQFPGAFTEMYRELDDLLADGKPVQGYFPVKVILATRS
ncbi:methyltransferase tpcM [Aspergillus novofumigatus IBT 16806]|uniref:Methyltransferase nsrG n=1 Tax=Aspergillus novofumigatus (strain IBT 16806) TaxID=1392255 RepID=NSRG_ASPN1|nr:S-adenosyl-L-methionine-dependent methyltransferase [Aspergillus novofumigatus IBT 16806]A0A2I1C3X9.1 RecName: Full=Methyltransferase nsrG; AltName: Full=Neosartorin biosynthesis cluster protein G [Aspergillus novofumigatus IBT 16806]PKX92303.1 S-adenosyl-L-methionine-dependent methyltransferase [Aspergillus novofumigatus IBT 16806]